jgi:hypothetical protein
MSRINDDLDAPFPEPSPPLPSRSELERFLPLMNSSQKAELLALLEARDRAQAAQPVDTTPSMEELIEMTWRSEAATRANPAAWLAAMKAHDKRRRYYMHRLSVGRPAPRTMRELLNFPQFEADNAEATRLATADGFPDPSAAADKPKIEDEVSAFLKDRGGRPMLSE